MTMNDGGSSNEMVFFFFVCVERWGGRWWVGVMLFLFEFPHLHTNLHITHTHTQVLVAFSGNWDCQDLPRYIQNEVQNR